MEDLRLRIDEMASRYGGQLRIHRIRSLRELARSGPPACGLVEVLTRSHLKNLVLQNILQRLGLGLILWYSSGMGRQRLD
jgi:hypothetical protein